jgi:hypothetical protein
MEMGAIKEKMKLSRCLQGDEWLRPPSPFILSPPSSLRFDAIAPKPKAKADRRGNSIRLFLVLRMSVRPIQSYKFSKEDERFSLSFRLRFASTRL